MASKTNRTSDDKHVQFGNTDTTSMPDGFTAPDKGATCSGWFGQTMKEGAASALIDDEYED